MKISLASPVYNERENIQEFIRRVYDTLIKLSNDIEIVLVNDCSKDDTVLKIKEIKKDYPCVKLINLTKNSGQHIASSIALQNSTGDYIFLMDSDLQINPEYMNDFYVFLKENQQYDVVSAHRKTRSNSGIRSIGSFFVSILLRFITKSKMKDIGSTFKLFNRKALDKLLSHEILIQNLPILIMNIQLTVYEYSIDYNIIGNRKSNYGFKDLVAALILALLNFSTGGSTLIALLMLGILGFFTGIILFSGLVIWGVINHEHLPNNLLILSSILLIVGLQFIFLGIVVFKIERINKNLDFRKSMNQHIEHD